MKEHIWQNKIYNVAGLEIVFAVTEPVSEKVRENKKRSAVGSRDLSDTALLYPIELRWNF